MNLMYVKISCSVKFLLPGMRPFFLESRGVVVLALDSPAGVVIFFFEGMVLFFFSYFFFSSLVMWTSTWMVGGS